MIETGLPETTVRPNPVVHALERTALELRRTELRLATPGYEAGAFEHFEVL